MQVRRGNAQDWPFIYELAKESIPDSISPLRKQELKTTMKYRERILKGFWTWIQQTNSVVFIVENYKKEKLGYLILYPSSREELTGLYQGWVMDIAVQKDFRRQGAGKLLMEAAEQYCREHKIVYLGLAVTSHNTNALRLYESRGFAEERKLMVKVLRE